MTIATVVLLAAFLQGSNLHCPRLDIAEDQQGVRVRDLQGNWRYFGTANIKPVLVARLDDHQGIWAHAVSKKILEDYFGGCAPVYAPMVAAAVPGLADLSASGQKVEHLGLGPGVPSGLPQYEPIVAISARLFVLDGTDLLVWDNRLYAVDDTREAIPLVGTSVQQREKMTGIVRQMAHSLFEKGATKLKVLKVELIDRKLQARLEIRAKGKPKETLFFQQQ